MSKTALAEGFAMALGLGVSAIVAAIPRFRSASLVLAAFLALGAMASGALAVSALFPLASSESWIRASLGALLLAVPAALAFTSRWRAELVPAPCALPCATASRIPSRLRTRLWTRLRTLAARSIASVVALSLAAAIQFVRPTLPEGAQLPVGVLLLGWPGFAAGLAFLVGSVAALSRLEGFLRGGTEDSRFEIKFLLLGTALPLAALVYLASRLLLYSPATCVLPLRALHTLPFAWLLGSVFVCIAWRRRDATSSLHVSQATAFGSLTLLLVGVYLVFSSTAAKFAGAFIGTQVETETIVFFSAGALLAVAALSSRVRGRLRHLVRRHLFSGRYDYRAHWLQATERFAVGDSIDRAAEAVADAAVEVAARGLKAEAASIWRVDRAAGGLRLLGFHGCGGPDLVRGRVFEADLERIAGLAQVLRFEEKPRAGRDGVSLEWIVASRARLVAPLRSGGDVLGVIVVGSDRSGIPYDEEASEFLGVLAAHAAGEIHKAELLRLEVEAKEAEAFRTFSTFVLHDLKNFASTLGLIAKNAERHRDNPVFLEDAFQSIQTTAEKMKRLCNGLRSFSGTLASRRSASDLALVAEDAASSLGAVASGRLQREIESVPLLEVDREEIAGVVRNLLVNAHEAAGEAGTVTLRVRADGEWAIVEVSDTGPGFSREYLSGGLFVPFRTTKSEGLGVGLFQSKKVVEAHGGKIEIESEAMKGSTVRVRLPLDPVPEDRACGGRLPRDRAQGDSSVARRTEGGASRN